MSGWSDFSTERMADRMEIQHRLFQFTRGIDRLDFTLLREAYHADGTDDHGDYNGKIEGFIDWLKQRHGAFPFCSHQIGNIFIEFASEDEAFCESYVTTWLKSIVAGTGEPSYVEQLFAGRYVDYFTRRDGLWKIQDRMAILEGAVDLPRPVEGYGAFERRARGRRDMRDPSQLLRSRLGLPRQSKSSTHGDA